MTNLGILTTSRADFGIYLPLIKKLEEHPRFEYCIFAGGMHTSPLYGMSVELIENVYGIKVIEKVVSLTNNNTPLGIAQSMGLTTLQFGNVWSKYQKELDAVVILGDRFEMFSAAAATIPFNIPIIHLHGGETTLGAIDNKFRHALTTLSDYHFTSHQKHAQKVAEIIGTTENVYNVGALSVDGAKMTSLMSAKAFDEKFNFDIQQPFFLTTYHPETVELRNNIFIKELLKAIKKLKIPVLCTLPNADTQGDIIRNAFLDFEKKHPELLKCYENLGQQGYFTAINACLMMLGNTSSGIIEAGAFKKAVINVGNRQKGRVAGNNVINVNNDAISIIDGYYKASQLKLDDFKNPFGGGQTAQKILNILEKELIKV
jgi:GDP/UDP-N,N'-diacetylbacillosamine 2-epimerase (hydrolysing)